MTTAGIITAEQAGRWLRGPLSQRVLDHVLVSDCCGPDGAERLERTTISELVQVELDECAADDFDPPASITIDCGRPLTREEKLSRIEPAMAMARNILDQVCDDEELCPHDPDDNHPVWQPWPELIAACEAVRQEIASKLEPYHRECATVVVDVAAWRAADKVAQPEAIDRPGSQIIDLAAALRKATAP